jgi:hypothetical protein
LCSLVLYQYLPKVTQGREVCVEFVFDYQTNSGRAHDELRRDILNAREEVAQQQMRHNEQQQQQTTAPSITTAFNSICYFYSLFINILYFYF